MRTLTLLSVPSLACACLVSLAAESSASAATYNLNPAQSLFYVQVFKDQRAPLARLSHDHVIRAGQFTGEVTFDPQHPESCAVTIDVAVAGLIADEPAMRQRVGYPQTLEDSKRREIDASMRGADQLDAATYPRIHFSGTHCEPTGPGTVNLLGEMELRGQRKDIALPVRFETDGTTLTASGSFVVTHADFGFRPFSAMHGALRNSENLTFVFEARGQSN